jgi:uncharacterized protein (DUF488 family)
MKESRTRKDLSCEHKNVRQLFKTFEDYFVKKEIFFPLL